MTTNLPGSINKDTITIRDDGENGFGCRRYLFGGAHQFHGFTEADWNLLKHGDSVQEDRVKGQTQYVHQCFECSTKGMRGMMVCIAYYCPSCSYTRAMNRMRLERFFDESPHEFVESLREILTASGKDTDVCDELQAMIDEKSLLS